MRAYVYLDLWLFSVCNRDRHDVQAKVLRRYIQAPSCELRGKEVEGSRETSVSTRRESEYGAAKKAVQLRYIYLKRCAKLPG